MSRHSGADLIISRRRSAARALAVALATMLAGCSGLGFSTDTFSGAPPPRPEEPPSAATAIGAGQVKIGLILPLSAGGNAGAAGQSMRDAAEMAVAEFSNPNIQLLVKDDGGTAQGAQRSAQQAVDEGAEVVLGPLFAHSVGGAAQVARTRSIPVIAFSTDSNVASRGVYLLSFLPETDVDRVVDYAIAQGRRSFVALLPDNAYGTVVEAAFKQAVGRKNGRVVALERYTNDRARLQETARIVADAATRADVLFIPDGGEEVATVVRALASSGVNVKNLQLIGTGLLSDDRSSSYPELEGAWYAAPDPTGYRAFAARYRTRYRREPARTATLAYDSVALVAALVKSNGGQRITDDVLTNPSGFAGIDGVFRFRPDGTTQRGLAVMRVTSSGGQVISPAPKTFGAT